jgi:hypothetical protein
MTEETESELVMVPVPRPDLMAVYEFLARRHAGVAEQDAHDVTPPDGEHPEAPWTVDELRKFAATGSTTNVTIGKVLDVLAAQPGIYFSTSELEKRTGVARNKLKGSMSALTRHLNKHYPGHGWMFEFVWGTHLGSDHPAEAHYRLDEPGAALWREARG